MLEQLESAEASRQTKPSGHDDLKVEIEHLRAAIGRLEKYGSMSATLPKKASKEPQSGELRYHMAYKAEKPRVQLTPLADIEVAKDTDRAVKSRWSSASGPLGPEVE